MEGGETERVRLRERERERETKWDGVVERTNDE